MSLLLGIDLGTSYFKVGLFEADGTMRGLGRVRVAKVSPAAGWSELPVEAFWTLLRRALSEALAEARATAAEIGGVSYSSQANTFVLLDAQDRPLTPLVFWTDDRAEPVDEDLAAFGRTPEFRRFVGSETVNAQMAPVKWRWWARHRAVVWARVARAMTISDYLTFALTGERVGDGSTAALLGLFDLERGGWWPKALATFGVDAAWLSRPLAPGTSGLVTRREARDSLALREGIPFAVGALDHYVAALGSGIDVLADVSISTGTVLAALTMTDEIAGVTGCFHGPGIGAEQFYRLAFDANGAGQLEAYQQQHCPELTLDELLAAAAPGRVESPAAAAHANAIGRLLEGIADRQAQLVRQVAGGRVRRVVATGGGARSPLLLQMTAEALRVPVVTTSCPERACLGAAAFAAVATGGRKDVPAAIAAMVREERVFQPRGVKGTIGGQ